MAFNKIDPIGKWREDYQISYLATVISNSFIQAFGKKNSNKLHSVSDFLINWEGNKQKKMTQKQLTQALLAWADSHNASIEKKSRKSQTPLKK